MKYEVIIGLEIHAELKTESKMFCGCINNPFNSSTNTNICPICLGMPGTLPVINRGAVEKVMMCGLALNAEINDFSKWDRKNYYYPDLPKGYQISQYDLPLTKGGYLEIEGRKIGITRVHLEEDTGKLIHPKGENYSLVDYNRAGVPLMELVTEPDIRSGAEAKQFAISLQKILRSLDIARADMEKGEMRVEVNISLRAKGEKEFGTKVEIKNLNSFRSVERAINYEIERQAGLLDNGKTIVQETRGWDENRQKTFPQRVKETAMDYRYFPEPDLPPIELDKVEIEKLKGMMPEIADEKKTRYINDLGLAENIAEIISAQTKLARFFEAVLVKDKKLAPKLVANWLVHKRVNLSISASNMAELLRLIDDGTISVTMGKEILTKMNETDRAPREIIKDKGMKKLEGAKDLHTIAKAVIENNSKAAKDYQSGKEVSLGFLVGQLMRETKGQADPKSAREILIEVLRN